MIKARVATSADVLLVFDSAKSRSWVEGGKVNSEGINDFLVRFKKAGLTMDSISATCLADIVGTPKAKDFKEKAEYLPELLDMYAFNVVVPVGAAATEKLLGFKGASKYFGKVMTSEAFPGQKVIPCPNPDAIKYNDNLKVALEDSIAAVVSNYNFPEVIEAEKGDLDYRVIDTLDKFKDMMTRYMDPSIKVWSYDLETTGFRFNVDEVLTIQLSCEVQTADLIPTPFYGGWTHDEWAYIEEELTKLFADDSKTLVGQNIKFDNRFMENWYGIPVRKHNVFDTMIASFLCDENTPNGLKDLACQYTDMGDYEFELEKFKKLYLKQHKMKVGDFSYKYIPLEVLTYYAQADADVTLRLYHVFKQKLVEEEQENVFAMVMRFQYLLTRMEITGSPVDMEYAAKYLVEIDAQIVERKAELMAFSYVKEAERIINADKKKPVEFNFNSTPQKRVLFFDVLKCRYAYFSKVKADVKTFTLQKKVNLAKRLYRDMEGKEYPTKDMPIPKMNAIFRAKGSTDKRSMAVWEKESTNVDLKNFITTLRRYAELVKIRNTYVFSLMEKTVNGFIHPKFNVTGARSGRLSCSDPNYQNIPAHSEEAKKVKRITKAPPGWVLIGADLSAAEMRWVTVASGDESMAAVFNSGKDSHGVIAKDIFPAIECDANEVKKFHNQERQISKACQFLSIYGGQAEALAATAGITEERADEILSAYFDKYTGISDYIKKTIDFIKVHGYSKSLLGRKNRHPHAVGFAQQQEAGHLSQQDNMELEKACRVGVNATIQSVSSDGMLIACCNLQDEIEARHLPMNIINVIHDAVYVLVREKFLQEGKEIIERHLSTFPAGLVNPFTGLEITPPITMEADAEWGYSWDKFSDDFGTALVELDEEEDEEFEEAA